MTTRTRYFMLGAASVLVAGLCTGLVAYYTGSFPTLALQAPGPEELRYVPGDASVVAYANVREIMESDFRQRFREVEPDERARQEFEEQTGINLETDIDHIVGCLMPAEGEETSGLVFFRGRFDGARLEALARERGGSVEDYNGKRLFFSQEQRDRGADRVATVAFLEPGLVVLGDDFGVRRAIDLPVSGQNVNSNDEFTELVGQIDTSSNAWAVGRIDELASRARLEGLPDEVASQLPAVTWFTAGARVDGGISGTIRVEARDEQAGENLRDVVRGFLALAKLQADSRPQLQAMVESLQVSGVGPTVAMSFRIPTEVIELLVPRNEPDVP